MKRTVKRAQWRKCHQSLTSVEIICYLTTTLNVLIAFDEQELHCAWEGFCLFFFQSPSVLACYQPHNP